MPIKIKRSAKRFTVGCVLTLGAVLAIAAPSLGETGDSTGIFQPGRVERHPSFITSTDGRARALTDSDPFGYVPIPEPGVDRDTAVQIEEIDRLMTRVDALGVDEPDPPFGPEGVYYASEVAAGPKCIEGKPFATGKGKVKKTIDGANVCKDVKAWVAKEVAIFDAKEANKKKGNKPTKVPKLTPTEEAAKKQMESLVKEATAKAQKDCDAKQTCTKGTCKKSCSVTFDDSAMKAPVIKCKTVSGRRFTMGKMRDFTEAKVKLTVGGMCGCTCACSM